MPHVRIPTPAGDIPGFLAVPDGPGPWPGVVVIHDALGDTTDLHRQAEWLADAGFLAVGPDLYHGRRSVRCVVDTLRQVASGSGPAFDDVEAARSGLLARPDCTGRVGVIGFCMGGGFAIVLAAGHGFDAASVNYGPLPGDADVLLAEACPVVASYGALDRGTAGAADRLDAILTANGVPHDVEEYAATGHSFLNEHDPGDVPVLVRAVLRLPGFERNEEAAADARRRIVAFFDTHLRS